MKNTQNIKDFFFSKLPWYAYFGAFIVCSVLACLHDYHIELPIRPVSSQYMNVFTYSDSKNGGKSTIEQQTLTDNEWFFTTFLSSEHEHPHVGFGVYIDTTGDQNGVDCSQFSSLSFEMKTLHAVPQMVQLGMRDWEGVKDVRPFRLSIETSTKWKKYTITFDRFKTPEWWTMQNNVLSTEENNLKQVKTISFENNNVELIGQNQQLYIRNVAFVGNDYTALWWYVSAGIPLLLLSITSLYIQKLRALKKKRRAKRIKEVKSQINTSEFVDNKTSEWQQLEQFFLENYTRSDLKMETIEDSLGWNSKKVNGVLKQATGKTFKSFLNDLRIEAACKLLQSDTKDSVSQIGYLVGFESPSHFSRVFKAQIGKTPGEYRKAQNN